MSKANNLPILVTSGEPAGIGPELCALLAETSQAKRLNRSLVILGDADLVEEVARIASLTKLEGKPLRRTAPGVPKPILTPQQMREKAARRTLAAFGCGADNAFSRGIRAPCRLYGFGGGPETSRA